MEELDEFAAAAEFKMSPTLLRWFTSYDAKKDGVKLLYSEKDDVYYFKKSDLASFNEHLKKPWNKKVGKQRPYVCTGIMDEIKEESGYRCEACNTNEGEVAHIEPVSHTLNNHPHNLIFLCSSHHRVYDYGRQYENLSKEEVESLKKAVHVRRAILWKHQKKRHLPFVALLKDLKRLDEIRKKNPDDVREDVEYLINLIFKALSNDEDANEKITAIIKKTTNAAISDDEKVSKLILHETEVVEIVRHDDSQKECPLCEGNGHTDYFETCPVCDGDRFISNGIDVDLSEYELKVCSLCDGSGHTEYYETCPPCSGEGKIPTRDFVLLDFSDYILVNCPICEGSGRGSLTEECQACGGEKQLSITAAAEIDLSDYQEIDCPLCKGNGSFGDYHECPECAGEGLIYKKDVSKVDLRKYEEIQCPICKGEGSYAYLNECPACEGNRTILKEQAEKIDAWDYELIDCPGCKGKGRTRDHDECIKCDGNKKVIRKFVTGDY